MPTRLVVLVVLLLLPEQGIGQTGGASVTGHRTPWGDPDLQGIWDYRTSTPLERPDDLKDTITLENEAAAAFEERRRALVEQRRADGLNADWLDNYEVGLADGRTALIVDPPSGRRPPLTSQAANRQEADSVRRLVAHGPEAREFTERCIIRQSAPLWVNGYNNNLQLFQTPDTVVLLHEMIHEAVVIPLDGRPHIPSRIRQWQGDARGHWDGDTLVIETTNRHPQWSFPRRIGPTPDMRVIERLTRLNADTLLYEYTVDDPDTFARSWSTALPMRRTDGPLYEYACHEGNYSLPLILTGARAAEVQQEVR